MHPDHEAVAREWVRVLTDDPAAMRAMLRPDVRIWHSTDGIWMSLEEAGRNAAVRDTGQREAPRFEDVRAQATARGIVAQATLVGLGDVPIHVVQVLTVEDGAITVAEEYLAPQRSLSPGSAP